LRVSEEKTIDRTELRLLDDLAVEQLPPPQWLIEDLVVTESLVLLFGEPEIGKTFLALALAMAVATGESWAGRRVKRGTVVYVAAEGAAGIGVRVRAAKLVRQIAGKVGIYFVDGPLHLIDRDRSNGDLKNVQRLIDKIRHLNPVFVVVDTLARCMLGADEDSARDMGLLIDAVDRIRRTLGCTVLLLHHPVKRKNANIERGSGALRGAVDTVIRMARQSGRRIIECLKQKDAEHFRPIGLTVKIVDLGSNVTSCVVVPDGPEPEVSTGCLPTSKLTANQRTALEALSQCPSGMSTLSEWRESVGAKERTFHRTVKSLTRLGDVSSVPGKRGTYRLSGRAAATATPLESDGQGSLPDPSAAATATLPLGVAGPREAAPRRTFASFSPADVAESNETAA
jgi:KaiC/GvpD/RAD55 family RecA-like ATPase